jgi:hypothetical protein
MHNFDSVALRQIEDQPVLEVSNAPTAESLRGRSSEVTANALPGHVCQSLECADWAIEKPLCRFETCMFLKIFDLSVDFTPSAAGWCTAPLRLRGATFPGTRTKMLTQFIPHLRGDLDSVTGIERIEEGLFKLIFGF